MKRVIQLTVAMLLLIGAIILFYCWDSATNRGYHFGYWGDYNRVHDTLLELTGGEVNILYLNRDVTLEEFGFSVVMPQRKATSLYFNEQDPARHLHGVPLREELTCRIMLLNADTSADALKPHPKAVANIHPPGEVDLPEMVKFVVTHATGLPGIVVDETAAELTGEWQYSTHTPPYVGLGYLHDMKAGKGFKSVTFTPDLPKAGWYEVRLAHCYNVRRSTKTPVTIHHADGDTTVRINQQQEPAHGHLFRTLGAFRFEAGRTGWVRVSNDGTEANKVVIADAVQFLPVKQPRSVVKLP